MKGASRLLARLRGAERAQALALFAGMGAALFGFVGISVDVGQLVATRTELQKTADAAVLAAAQELPSAERAVTVADEYVARNAGPTTTHTVVIGSNNYANDSVTVVASRRVDFVFLRVLGVRGKGMTATATARRTVLSSIVGRNLVPWGMVAPADPSSSLLSNECYVGQDAYGLPIFKTKTHCSIKYGSGYAGGGEFGALRLDGASGADAYRDKVAVGSSNVLATGDTLTGESGNMAGPTRDGVIQRLNMPAPAGCPGTRYNQALIDNPDGTVTVRPGCEQSARLIVIPIVDRLEAGGTSRVVGFAMMWLHGVRGPDGVLREYPTQANGQDRIVGEFIRLVTPLSGAGYSATVPNGASAISIVN